MGKKKERLSSIKFRSGQCYQAGLIRITVVPSLHFAKFLDSGNGFLTLVPHFDSTTIRRQDQNISSSLDTFTAGRNDLLPLDCHRSVQAEKLRLLGMLVSI